MGVYKRGKIWWYKFNWNGEPVRESTKQANKRVAEQIEAAHRTALAKGEVGIREKRLVPTLRKFAEDDFLPFARSTFASKPKTLAYYEYGVKSLLAYRRALVGIRATQRDETPVKPRDPFVLRDVATVLLDCGLRPEECFRLGWETVRDGVLEIQDGKTENARRRIPLSSRVAALLDMRRSQIDSKWVFPAPTKSGHIEPSSLKKQHLNA